MSEESFLDRSSLVIALDEAKQQGYQNVRVQHVLLSDELTCGEIATIRSQEEATRRKAARDELIAEKALTPEQVALIAEV
jgi:hypothetical protein